MLSLFRLNSSSNTEYIQEFTLDPSRFACDFIIKKINGVTYVLLLEVDLDSNDDGIYEKRGKLIWFEIQSQPGSLEAELTQISKYEFKDGAMTVIQDFTEKYIIWANNKICIFDVSNPENLWLESSTLISDLVLSIHPLNESRIVCSYFTPNSSWFQIETSEMNRRISLRQSGNDYDGDSEIILYPYDHIRYLAAERDGMVRLNQYNPKPKNDDQKFRIMTKGKFNTHTQTSCITKGNLKKDNVQIYSQDENLHRLHNFDEKSFLLGSACGHITAIQTISKEQFDILNYVESIMSNEFKGFGGFEQALFRQNNPFDDPYDRIEVLDTHKMSKRFVDGDFLNIFVSLPESKQKEILKKVSLGTSLYHHLMILQLFFRLLIQIILWYYVI